VKVIGRAYLGLGLVVAIMGAVYWFTSYENAGTTMLVLASILALFLGGYLALTARRATTHGSGQAEPYLPHASVWPFFVGAAALVAANGLALGLFALVPGVIALGIALAGYAGQSRRRD
jgi:peptidoglycan/LPS O-acetylase OafA/YrhL